MAVQSSLKTTNDGAYEPHKSSSQCSLILIFKQKRWGGTECWRVAKYCAV